MVAPKVALVVLMLVTVGLERVGRPGGQALVAHTSEAGLLLGWAAAFLAQALKVYEVLQVRGLEVLGEVQARALPTLASFKVQT